TNTVGGVISNIFVHSTSGLIKATDGSGRSMLFSNNVAGWLLFATNANQEVITHHRDSSGTTTNLVDGKGQQTTVQLDPFGRQTNKLDNTGASMERATYYVGTALSSNVWTPAGGTTIKVRDNVGQLLTNVFAVGVPESWIYNSNGWWTSMADGVGTTTRTYTDAGQLLTEGGLWSGDTVSR